MRKGFALLAVLGVLAAYAVAEPKIVSISATDASATTPFTKPAPSVLVCNWGANEVFYRLFDSTDTQGAATTSSIQLVAGTATAPVCKSYQDARQFVAISTICSGGETATVTVEFN